MKSPKLPERIICLTEESVELLYLLGEEHRIVGVSQYAVRPERVKEQKPVVSVFTHANQKKVLDLKPDLIIGYSDIQKDIAKAFIEMGQNVFIANHRTLEETLSYCWWLSNLVGAGERYQQLQNRWQEKIQDLIIWTREEGRRFKVYIEEWDEPRISGIRYFSELLELAGFDDIHKELRDGFLAKDRHPLDDKTIHKNPDVIFGCWCGKPVDIESIKSRTGWDSISAVKNDLVIELPPEVFLQPGPALFETGLDYLKELNQQVTQKSGK
jgi:iron complex transport system substrate-binding protein